jgi:hypothetical protein
MRVKMNQPVRWSDGTIATPREMLDRGLAEVRTVERFIGSPGGPIRRAVFVDRIGTMSGVEVSGYVAREGGEHA